MGMKGENALQRSKYFGLLKPTTLNSGGTATIDGAAINEPWRLGRRLVFGVRADVPASSGLTVKVIGKKRSDGNWEVVTDKAAAEIAFPTSKLADGAAVETDGLVGEIDLSRFKSETYSDVTLRIANGQATNVVAAAWATVEDLYSIPSGQTDEFAAVELQ